MPRKPALQTSIPGFGFIFRPSYRDKTTKELKHSAVWWMEFRTKDKPVRRSTRQTDQAQAFAELLKVAGKRASGHIVTSDPERILVSQLLELVYEDYEHSGQRTLADVKARAKKHLEPAFGDLKAIDVTTRMIRDWAAKQKATMAPATINRTLAILRRAYHLGYEHEPQYVLRIPKIQMLEVDNVRTGVLEPDVYRALRDELAPHARLALVIGYHTGMRRGEICSIRWDQVDLEAGVIRLEKKQTKGKAARVAPIYGEMRAYLDMAKAERDAKYPQCQHVVAEHGKRIFSFKTAWNAAQERLGLSKVLVHDLRRTALTNMDAAGIPRHIAMSISGHKTESVYRRYLIGSEKAVVEAGKRVQDHLETSCITSSLTSSRGVS